MSISTLNVRLHLLFTWLLLLICSKGLAQPSNSVWLSAKAIAFMPVSDKATAAIDGQGNTYTIGTFRDTLRLTDTILVSRSGSLDGCLIKYSPTGQRLWLRQIGSVGPEFLADVSADATGNVYVTGSFTHAVALGGGFSLRGGSSEAYKGFVIRYSPQGVPQWVQQSESGGQVHTIGRCLRVDNAGHVFVAGDYTTSVTLAGTTLSLPTLWQSGLFLSRLNVATGAVESLTPALTYQMGSTLPHNIRMTVSPTGTVYITDSFQDNVSVGNNVFTGRGTGDALVVKLSAQGSIAWAVQVGGPDYEFIWNSIADAAGNLYVLGCYTNNALFGNTACSTSGTSNFVAKFSAAGSLEWIRNSGPSESYCWFGIALDAGGNPCVGGGFGGSIQLGSQLLTSPVRSPRNVPLVASYTPQGQLRWTVQAAADTLTQNSGGGINSLGIDAAGAIHLMGSIGRSCTFGPYTISDVGGFNAFLAHFVAPTLAVRTVAHQLLVRPFPNPATNEVRLPGLTVGTAVQLLDVTGRTIRTVIVTAAQPISVRGLAAGLYMLRATDVQGRHYVGRLVIE